MPKKMWISISLVIFMTILVSCSNEPDPEKEVNRPATPAEIKESKRRVNWPDVKNEPPMTEDEIVLYIRILPEFTLIEDVDPVKEINFYKKYKLTKNRFFYLRGKIANTFIIINGYPLDLSHLPESARPNETEMELVEKHFQEIKAASHEFQELQRNR